MWGARVLEVFGMSEVGHMGAERVAGEGFRVWTDMHFIEVLDEDTGEPVGEGETGTLVVKGHGIALVRGTGAATELGYPKREQAQFPASACDGCPQRAQCTTARIGQGRSLSIREDAPFQHKLRAKIKTKRRRAALRKRGCARISRFPRVVIQGHPYPQPSVG